MSTDILLGLGIGLIIGIGFYMFMKSRKKDEVLSKDLEQKLIEVFPEVLKNANEQLISMANQKLGAEKQDIKTDLDNKRKQIEKLVEQVQKELRDNDRTAQSLLQQIRDHEKITKDLSVTTEGLKKVLTNNQLRGQFGEQVAEDLLRMAGFVKGIDYEAQKAQSSSARPDFSIFLPDKTRINVDVKFPYSNLQKATETEDRAQKKQLLKEFGQDVRKKINQITTRDYINPDEKTVDFVILFVPNEMIFSYIYDKMHDVWEEAMKKKVILAGPFSFTAILRMVHQAHQNFRYQENIQHIVGYIKQFEKQFEMYNEEFDRLGSQLQTVSNTYHKVESTRTRQLGKIVEKIRLESDTESTRPKKVLEAEDIASPKTISSDSDDIIH